MYSFFCGPEKSLAEAGERLGQNNGNDIQDYSDHYTVLLQNRLFGRVCMAHVRKILAIVLVGVSTPFLTMNIPNLGSCEDL